MNIYLLAKVNNYLIIKLLNISNMSNNISLIILLLKLRIAVLFINLYNNTVCLTKHKYCRIRK